MVTAKFKCTSKTQDEYATTVLLHPVSRGEDEDFFKATPSGEIKLGVVNQAAADQFTVGKQYLIEFTEV